jgi:hypothetical protein
MNIQIKKYFLKVLVYSLNSRQINFLGERLDSTFDLYSESGFGRMMPIPQQTAAETLLDYFDTEEEIVLLFTYLLRHEGSRFYDRDLKIWGGAEFIKILEKYKWIYDEELIQFFMDPFYEHDINFLNDVRIIDLRENIPIKKIVNGITKLSKGLGIHDLEWRITLRLYDLEPKIAELIRKIIELLLVRQNLQKYVFEIFTCLKELALNASKANYKLLFEKYFSREQQVSTQQHYEHFLRLFKEEIAEHGNKRLAKLARQDDKFINIIFQSTNEAIEIWVTNSQNISLIEKEQLLKKLHGEGFGDSFDDDDDLTEGAGFGINLVLSILRKYSQEKDPLNVIFYPNFVKIGFSLKRRHLSDALEVNENN